MLLISSLLLGATSCKNYPHVKIEDVEVCVDKVKLGARCKHTLSGSGSNISPEEWDKMRLGRISFTAEGFENWKTGLETLCYQTKRCDYETLQIIIQNLNEIIDTAHNQ